jgi:hypothetical protein
MSKPVYDDEEPLDPAAERIVARVRRLMLISALTTFGGIAIVVAVIGYRVLTAEGSAPSDAALQLPAGARIVSTAVSGDRLAVTIEIAGATEVRTYDLRTLRPTGTLRITTPR